MMRAAILLLILLVPAAAAVQPVEHDYVHLQSYPSFQYRVDRDVRVPVQAHLVLAGVPQEDDIVIRVRTEGGEDVPVRNAAALQGIAPYPARSTVNLGRLDAGLYRFLITAEAGGHRTEQLLVVSVVYPPKEWNVARLVEAGPDGRSARFLFEADNEFRITVYRNGAGGRVVLEEVVANRTSLRVPYVRSEPVFVEVVDRHGWVNAHHTIGNPLTGESEAVPWVWYPDVRQTEQWQAASLPRILAALLLAGLAALALFAAYWRRA